MQNVGIHLVRGAVATGAILAAEAAAITAHDWIAMVERLGLAVALVVFFVATGWAREQRMSKRIDKLEKDNARLSGQLATLTAQINETLRQENLTMDRALAVLNARTCYAFRNREEFERMRELVEAEQGDSNAPGNEEAC